MNASHLARFDPLGNLIWSKKIAANTIGFFSSLTRRPDGVILMSGFDPSQGFGRSSVVFLDENGTVLDTRYYGLPNHQSVILNTIVANADNTFTVAGSSRCLTVASPNNAALCSSATPWETLFGQKNWNSSPPAATLPSKTTSSKHQMAVMFCLGRRPSPLRTGFL